MTRDPIKTIITRAITNTPNINKIISNIEMIRAMRSTLLIVKEGVKSLDSLVTDDKITTTPHRETKSGEEKMEVIPTVIIPVIIPTETIMVKLNNIITKVIRRNKYSLAQIKTLPWRILQRKRHKPKLSPQGRINPAPVLKWS